MMQQAQDCRWKGVLPCNVGALPERRLASWGLVHDRGDDQGELMVEKIMPEREDVVLSFIRPIK